MEQWTLVRPLTGECLYATFDSQGPITVTQYVLSGFERAITDYISREPPMRGMWAGEKASNGDYRPAIDGLSACDGNLVRDAILAAISTGAAISISCTRDFGALVLTLLDGNQKHKVYPTDAQEIAQAFTDLKASFTNETPPQASKGGKR